MVGVDSRIVLEDNKKHIEETNPSSFSWGYEKYNGPSKWGEYFPLASSGKRQSPIDLPGGVSWKVEKINSGAVNRSPIAFSDGYWDSSVEGELSNNGHSLKFQVGIPNDFKIKKGPYGNEEYQFQKLHFHWGSIDSQGSEHTINGKRFPMEMHMVHVNSKYVKCDGTVDSTCLSSGDGLAVLGFVFELGDDDCTTLESITTGITTINCANGEKTTEGHVLNIQLNLGQFLNSSSANGYYTYPGSLTTPGCNECVTWVIFKETIGISKRQIASFRSLKDHVGNPLVNNFRPTQTSNGRRIEDGRSGENSDA